MKDKDIPSPEFEPKKRITYKQYRKFIKDFDKQGQLRLGQAFCNLFNFQGNEDFTYNKTQISLFYETDRVMAHQRILSNYVGEGINNGIVGW